MVQSTFPVTLPKYSCSFANLWFKLFLFSNRLTYERLIYKYIVYTIYIISIVAVIYSSLVLETNTNEKDFWFSVTIFLYLLSVIGIVFDLTQDYDWSPTQELSKCCKCKKKNNTSECDGESAPASQTVTEV